MLAEALKVRLGPVSRLQIFGVLMPGTIVLVEAWLFVVRNDVRRCERLSLQDPMHCGSLLDFASRLVADVNVWLLIMVLIFVLFLAYAVGYIARFMSWGLANVFVARMDVEALVQTVLADYPDGREAIAQIRRMVDCDTRDLDRRQRLRRWLRRLSVRTGGYGVERKREIRIRVLHYTKSWLALFFPDLNVRDIEPEINALFGVVVPLFAAAPLTLWWFPTTAPGGVIAIVIMLLGTLTIRRGNIRRHEEVDAALRNYVLAHYYREESRRDSTMALQPAAVQQAPQAPPAPA
jgi:hypothetical protein